MEPRPCLLFLLSLLCVDMTSHVCPVVDLNIILVSVRVFVDKMNMWIGRLSQGRLLSPVWVGLIQPVDWLEQRADSLLSKRFSCLAALELEHQIFWLASLHNHVSQFLKFVTLSAPRYILPTGSASFSAGSYMSMPWPPVPELRHGPVPQKRLQVVVKVKLKKKNLNKCILNCDK